MQRSFKVSVHDFVLPPSDVTRPRAVDVVFQTGDDPSGQSGCCLLDGREDRVFYLAVIVVSWPHRGSCKHNSDLSSLNFCPFCASTFLGSKTETMS